MSTKNFKECLDNQRFPTKGKRWCIDRQCCNQNLFDLNVTK